MLSKILNKTHNRDEFDCGIESLNRFLKERARQEADRQVSQCFVVVDENEEVLGYYTLSSDSIQGSELPEKLRKKLPKYDRLPVTLLGRLAIDKSCQGKRLGTALLGDALLRTLEVSKNAIGSIAVVVDPIDDAAMKFYTRFGFIALDSGRMFLPMKVVENWLAEN